MKASDVLYASIIPLCVLGLVLYRQDEDPVYAIQLEETEIIEEGTISILLTRQSGLDTYNMSSKEDSGVLCDKKQILKTKKYTIKKEKEGYSINNNLCKTIDVVQGKIHRFVNGEHFPLRDTNHTYPDNTYRGGLLFSMENGKHIVVNTLPVNDYLRGIAEVHESTHKTKAKVMSLLVSSYVEWFRENPNRYSSKIYQGTDSPNSFQKYIGQGYESRSPLWQETITWLGNRRIFSKKTNKIVKLPYYSCTQSRVGKTLLPSDIGRNGGYYKENKNIFKSVSDTIGIDNKRDTPSSCGHGVGASGKGMQVLSEQGRTRNEILLHYFNDINIQSKA